ncbi:MvaI/BcnI restriction endonuclease family protein [Marixanthomonas spongiae]|uniref:MvaI/BcnI restriction endonuclease family protein n=1 Tax=Marixanthomonas spongiae TaxID=2174845 RepID=A0A2U0HXG1_9FLAO|nr:MvaI/BcnI restriction endonuclease family protein [Marixanthomonas spongiae]PVW13554.1 MvaI/BcnI restriction endonuclease family protein [Marixanthomonas spongiae]
MRELSNAEQSKLKLLTKNQVSLTLIEPTETGLKKSIMDATGSVRSYLKDKNIHDYGLQQQGPKNKVMIPTTIHTGFKTFNKQASLYRPITKNGDPRIWFYGLTKFADANDIIAITFFDNRFHIFNLTKLDVESLMNSTIQNPFQEVVAEINSSENTVAFELLAMLRKVANSGPVPSMVDADTAVGRSLERALKIPMNSSKNPDYKGIELKSYRSNRTNRKNLFAQVPNWKLSKFKSSAEILDAFGYDRGDDFKLYCTVSAITRNSQGLNLRIDSDIAQLIENSDKPEIGDFVIWTLDKLHNRLKAKHKETFWVEAESTRIDGREHFQYTFVEHTKKPITSQFDLLVEQGIITLDHLIKRNSKGKVVEKGPLFKIKPKGIELLFPPSENYNLLL